MKRFAIIVTILYAIIILLLTWPVTKIAFLGPMKHPVDIGKIFQMFRYWIWLPIMVIGQFALLSVPVRIADKRPVTKGPLIFSVIAAALMMGCLAAGIVLSIGETLERDALSEPVWWLALGEMILVWLLWAFIFFRWGKNLEPKNFVEKQCRYLFRGSVLELLIAVPTHVLARCRDYCCAGFATFVGIAFGISIMIFSFGPGVFFLYVERWKKLHPEGVETKEEIKKRRDIRLKIISVSVAAFIIIAVFGSVWLFYIRPSIIKSKIPAYATDEIREDIKKLYSLNSKEVLKALEDLRKSGKAASPAVPVLIESLGNSRRLNEDNDTLDFKAMLLLEYIARTDENVAILLMQALNNKNWHIRKNAAQILGHLYDRRATKSLIISLQDRNKNVRQAAASAIGYIRDATATEDILKIFNNEDEEKNVRISAGWAIGRTMDRRAVEPLIASLGNRKEYIREAAASALGDIKDNRATEPLVSLVTNKDEAKAVRVAVAVSLAKIGDASAVGSLTANLKDPEEEVRSSSASALGNLGGTQVFEPLIDALNDKDASVRKSAAFALGKIKDKRAVMPLIRILYLDTDDDVKGSAAGALGMIKDPRAIEPLIKTLGINEKYSNLSYKASAALHEITGENFGQEVDKWEKWQMGK